MSLADDPSTEDSSPIEDGDLNRFVPAELRARFRAVDHLGAGSYGSVYQVVDRESMRRFALKVTRDDPDAHARAAREVEANKALHHPNILVATDLDPRGKWFVLPLAEGTLGQLHSWGVKDGAAAHEVAWALCRALEHAHEKQFIHRDLHLDNIFWHDGMWKVGDWGLAVARGNRRLTRTRSVGGTETWTAPEQLRNLKSADARSDMFSVGRIVQWLASGSLPTVGRPADLVSDEPLALFVNTTTQLEPMARPASAREAMSLLPSARAPTGEGGAGAQRVSLEITPPPSSPATDADRFAKMRQWLSLAEGNVHGRGVPIVFSSLDAQLKFPPETASRLFPGVVTKIGGWAIRAQGEADIDLFFDPHWQDHRLVLDFKRRPASNGEVHWYDLLPSFSNTGKKRLDDWEIVVEFPTPFLEPGVIVACRVAERSNRQRTVFRWGSETLKAPLRVGDTNANSFGYYVNDEMFWNRKELFDKTVVVQASVNGTVVKEISRAFRELQNF